MSQKKLDRYYTKPEIISHVLDKIIETNSITNIYIDFSAGNNAFIDMFKERSIRPKKFFAFDLMPLSSDITKKNWFDVKREDVGNFKSENISIGFNPPYGRMATLVRKFVEHSYKEFSPEYFYLLVPKSFKMDGLPYRPIYFEKIKRNAFYLPESKKDVLVPTVFWIFKKSNDLFIGRKSVIKIQSDNVKVVSNKITENTTFVIGKYGPNYGRNIYILEHGKPIWYLNLDKKFIKITNGPKHNLNLTSFAKVNIKSKLNLDDKKKLALFLHENRDTAHQSYLIPNTTNVRINNLVVKWLDKK